MKRREIVWGSWKNNQNIFHLFTWTKEMAIYPSNAVRETPPHLQKPSLEFCNSSLLVFSKKNVSSCSEHCRKLFRQTSLRNSRPESRNSCLPGCPRPSQTHNPPKCTQSNLRQARMGVLKILFGHKVQLNKIV